MPIKQTNKQTVFSDFLITGQNYGSNSTQVRYPTSTKSQCYRMPNSNQRLCIPEINGTKGIGRRSVGTSTAQPLGTIQSTWPNCSAMSLESIHSPVHTHICIYKHRWAPKGKLQKLEWGFPYQTPHFWWQPQCLCQPRCPRLQLTLPGPKSSSEAAVYEPPL